MVRVWSEHKIVVSTFATRLYITEKTSETLKHLFSAPRLWDLSGYISLSPYEQINKEINTKIKKTVYSIDVAFRYHGYDQSGTALHLISKILFKSNLYAYTYKNHI